MQRLKKLVLLAAMAAVFFTSQVQVVSAAQSEYTGTGREIFASEKCSIKQEKERSFIDFNVPGTDADIAPMTVPEQAIGIRTPEAMNLNFWSSEIIPKSQAKETDPAAGTEESDGEDSGPSAEPAPSEDRTSAQADTVPDSEEVSAEAEVSQPDSGKEETVEDTDKGEEIVAYAEQFIGCPYVCGGDSLTEGCDCSHFVWRVLMNCGAYSGGYLTSGEWSSVGTPVDSLQDAKAGDIIIYSGHVAIYDGNGMIVEAKGAKYGITHDRQADCKSIMAIRRFC